MAHDHGPCAERDCARRATHAVKLYVPPTGFPADPKRSLSMILGVKFCRDHAQAFRPEQLLDVPNEKGSTLRDAIPALARVAAAAQGRDPDAIAAPSADRAWCEAIRLDADEYAAIERMTSTKH